MLINPDSLRHWMKYFYGYGSWKSSLWFVAHEESGGDTPEEVSEKLEYFLGAYPSLETATLCDIRQVYKRTGIYWDGTRTNQFKNRYEYRFGENAVVNKVWENMLAFKCGYYGHDMPNALEYQQNQFVTGKSGISLLRLFPLPGASHHGWNYNWLDLPEEFSFLKTRRAYEEAVYLERIQTLLTEIERHKPKIVLMYGMSNISSLKSSVKEYFQGTSFRQVKSVKRVIPQHHVAKVGSTRLLITTQIPALRHNRVETGFDWLEFGRHLGS